MAEQSELQGRRLAYIGCLSILLPISHWYFTRLIYQIPLAGMTTTTGLTVRYGEGKHIIFVTSAAGFSKVREEFPGLGTILTPL